MDVKIVDLIESVAAMIDYQNIDAFNSFVFSFDNSDDGGVTFTQNYYLLSSVTEPVRTLNYINGCWVNLDSNSDYYQKVLRLVGLVGGEKPGPISPLVGQPIGQIRPINEPLLERRWEIVTDIADIFRYPHTCFLEGATKGEIGERGRKGNPGKATYPNYDNIINSALVRLNQSL